MYKQRFGWSNPGRCFLNYFRVNLQILITKNFYYSENRYYNTINCSFILKG